MQIIIFDTLKAKKKLTAAGFQDSEAEAIVFLIYGKASEMCENITKTISTKEDVLRMQLQITLVLFSMVGLIATISAAAVLRLLLSGS